MDFVVTSIKSQVMFAYESIDIYKRSRSFNLKIRSFLSENKVDYATEDQLRRAALSIVLNLAEGSCRFTNKDMRRFYIISRSSVFECAALLDILHEEAKMNSIYYKGLAAEAEEISKTLFKMIRKLST